MTAADPRAAHYARRQAETQQLILRAIKTRLERGSFSSEDAVNIAYNQIMRPRGPRLSEEGRTALLAGLRKLAPDVEPPTARALYAFAKDAAALAWLGHVRPRSPLAQEDDAWFGVDVLAEAAVAAELAARGDSFGADDLVQRAVRRALHARRKARIGALVPLADRDPLRALLEVPPTGAVRLPGRDVRAQMARVLSHESPMSDAIRRSAAFHSTRLEQALGPLLWALGRPVGYADRHQKRLLVASATSTAAQETQLSSGDILYRLKQLPEFAELSGIRVVVDADAFHLYSRES